MKFENKDEAKKALATAKEEYSSAKEERTAFEKENKLEKGGDHSGDAKLGKKWTKLNDAANKKKGKVDEIKEALDELKAVKTPRNTKYEYPAGEGGKEMTAGEKKKYRAKMRAEAKKEAKGEKKEKKESKKGEGKKEKKKEKELAEAED